MDAERMAKAFRSKYPGLPIILEPSAENPTAVICEIVPASENRGYSVARVALGSFEAHYHKESSQTFDVLRGKLVLRLALSRKEVVVMPGRKYVVPPNMVHSGESETEDTLVEVTSCPGWTPDDRIFVNRQSTDSPPAAAG